MRAGLQNTALLLASDRSTASPHWVVDICHLHTNLISASWDSARPCVNVVLQRVPYPVCLSCARLPGVPYCTFSGSWYNIIFIHFTETVSLFRHTADFGF